MRTKRARAPTSPLDVANRKSDDHFIADYLQPRLVLVLSVHCNESTSTTSHTTKVELTRHMVWLYQYRGILLGNMLDASRHGG
jgi:hypothetical protein